MSREVKLHLGCGGKFIIGRIHVELADYPHIDCKRNISDLSTFDDNSVDLIYCGHAVEYFDREEIQDALKEWYRALKKGGVIRVAVPDFEAIVNVYPKYNDLNHRGILGPLYGRIVIKTPEGEKIIYHKTVYDFKSLKEILEPVDFENICGYDWCMATHKNYDDFSQNLYSTYG